MIYKYEIYKFYLMMNNNTESRNLLNNNSSLKKEGLSKKEMLSYSIGAIPGVLHGYIFGLYYVDFFYDDLQLLPAYFIIGQIIYAIINGLNDPLLGQLSDKTNRERWGGSENTLY